MSKFIVIPTIVANIWVSCAREEPGPPLPVRATDIRLSASVPTDVDELAGVRLELTPAEICPGFWDDADDEDISSYSEDLELAQMVWPNGRSIASAADEHGYWLAETAFVDVAPGCYDVRVAPIDVDGEPLSNCQAPIMPINVDSYTSIVVDLPILCGEPPRAESDVLDTNFAPHIEKLAVESEVSTCEIAKVCATARDADHDMLVFEWAQPEGLDQGSAMAVWPTIVEHQVNPDRSVTQCIRVQAHEPGSYDIMVEVYDVVRPTAHEPPVHIEDAQGMVQSHANASVNLDATLGCAPNGRSAVILLTLNSPGLAVEYARTLIGNTVFWASESVGVAPVVLVVLDDNHRGEDQADGEFVHAQLGELDIAADYMIEPIGGLTMDMLEGYDLVWFVNPGFEIDDADTHTTLLRYRERGRAVVLQGDDIARFRGNPQFMEPLTYLSWQGNGTVACGALIDDNLGATYTVEMLPDLVQEPAEFHPIMTGLRGVTFEYGNDIDTTLALGRGERVLAWATHEASGCTTQIPVVVALEPDELLPW